MRNIGTWLIAIISAFAVTSAHSEVTRDEVIDSLSDIENQYELAQKLAVLPKYGPFDEADIARIENEFETLIASIENELIQAEVSRATKSTVDTLRYASTDEIHHFGLIQTGLNTILLHTPHRGLLYGTEIRQLGADNVFVVIKKASDERESWIDLRSDSPSIATYEIAPLNVGIDQETIDNQVAVVSVDIRVENLSHTSCTSEEGIHHSVWSTQGRDKERLWSAYQYLGYATEPTCSEEELAAF